MMGVAVGAADVTRADCVAIGQDRCASSGLSLSANLSVWSVDSRRLA